MAPFIPELGEGEEPCEEAAPVCREEVAPLRAAYFYQTGCNECNRVETDIEYMEQQYPQLVIDRFNIYDELPLAKWMAQQAGYDPNDIHTPAFFIGEDVLVGEEEITPHNLRALMEAYAPEGTEAYWVGVDPDETDIPSILKVTFAGLVDGLNPCAFATLIFFISYLTASQRRGREILIAGAAFTLGVFLAYVAVGMGLYRFLDYLQEEVSFMQQVGRWVYGLTALMCAVLAVLSFLDYLKARRGEVEDMNLSLPESLRKRTRSAIRSGQKARTFVMATFFTGLVVSLLELACTGQLYLPTIIYMVSEPGMRAQGTLYLLLYNLMFILPLVVVFVLAYFGLTTYQLGLFFKRHMATVKLLTAVVFVSLAVWLGTALISG
jgi:cytochrome c biogenesis protein CcdA